MRVGWLDALHGCIQRVTRVMSRVDKHINVDVSGKTWSIIPILFGRDEMVESPGQGRKDSGNGNGGGWGFISCQQGGGVNYTGGGAGLDIVRCWHSKPTEVAS